MKIFCVLYSSLRITTKYILHPVQKGSEIPISQFVESIEHKVPNKFGGGQHDASIEKFGMEIISPFVISMPINYSDVKLHLLATHLFQNSRISIGHKHNIHILKNMTESEIINLFEIHDNVCEHQYVTVFHPYKKNTKF